MEIKEIGDFSPPDQARLRALRSGGRPSSGGGDLQSSAVLCRGRGRGGTKISRPPACSAPPREAAQPRAEEFCAHRGSRLFFKASVVRSPSTWGAGGGALFKENGRFKLYYFYFFF